MPKVSKDSPEVGVDPEFKLVAKSTNLVDQTAVEQKVKNATDELRKETEGIKKQYIEIFGIFAAIITFLGIEVQAFNKIDSFSKMVGFSFILLTSVLFLVYSIERISNRENQKISRSPIIWFCFLSLTIAFVFFWYEVSGKVLFWTIHR